MAHPTCHPTLMRRASARSRTLRHALATLQTQVLKSKTETYSVWDRNLQLAFWSSLIYAPIMVYDNPRSRHTSRERWARGRWRRGVLLIRRNVRFCPPGRSARRLVGCDMRLRGGGRSRRRSRGPLHQVRGRTRPHTPPCHHRGSYSSLLRSLASRVHGPRTRVHAAGTQIRS